ncbi:hypothetical protein CCM_05919 [Cordyceps militaris CM01]|uniref:Uncharacterized protein n=1 Tax=Cordyceps militaris (strain CM01) TaxID=983644 RepID=G3JHQ6_CORMM|nr:uncharacterized protein CCM_05919 [Cordyceps militaris CM01]EGX91762.1 hypothetical protein CCM_05919 [Cordyceps militaris CM01]
MASFFNIADRVPHPGQNKKHCLRHVYNNAPVTHRGPATLRPSRHTARDPTHTARSLPLIVLYRGIKCLEGINYYKLFRVLLKVATKLSILGEDRLFILEGYKAIKV